MSGWRPSVACARQNRLTVDAVTAARLGLVVVPSAVATSPLELGDPSARGVGTILWKSDEGPAPGDQLSIRSAR